MLGVANPDRADRTHTVAEQIVIAEDVFWPPFSFTAVYVPPFT
jgi:hypothetical protein